MVFYAGNGVIKMRYSRSIIGFYLPGINIEITNPKDIYLNFFLVNCLLCISLPREFRGRFASRRVCCSHPSLDVWSWRDGDAARPVRLADCWLCLCESRMAEFLAAVFPRHPPPRSALHVYTRTHCSPPSTQAKIPQPPMTLNEPHREAVKILQSRNPAGSSEHSYVTKSAGSGAFH